MSHLLENLTPAQREAVNHDEGPLLVVAGAGSGKTRVVTRRVARLIERGVSPREILAITFTNKAAREMEERIELLTEGAHVWVSTFHSFCARLLRRYGNYVGYTRGFTILDDGDQRILMREALIKTNTDPKLITPPKALYAVERLKDQLLTPEKAQDMAEGLHEGRIAAAYAVYQQALRDSNALDFSDLLMQAVFVLRQPEVKERIDRRFRYVLIDEYQDTNHAQYSLARLLSDTHGNLCATGDPDQSIYGWRGADVRNILEFEREHEGARVIRLEENFRSTQLILDAANGLIARNRDRHEKNLRSSAGEGHPVDYAHAEGEMEEARLVSERIQARIRRGQDPEEIAVLYRVGALSRSIETALRQRGIDYRVVGSVAFFQRREVKDLIAYLRLVQNPDDEVAFRRVINVPPRGIGKTTLNKILTRGAVVGSSFEAVRELSSSIRNRRTRAGMKRFVEVIETLRSKAEEETKLERLLREILAATDYKVFLADSAAHQSEEQERLANIDALCVAAHDFDRRWTGGPLLLPNEEPFLPPPAPATERKASPSKRSKAKARARARAKEPDLPLFAGLGLPAATPPEPDAEAEPEASEASVDAGEDTSQAEVVAAAAPVVEEEDPPAEGVADSEETRRAAEGLAEAREARAREKAAASLEGELEQEEELGGVAGFLEYTALVSAAEDEEAQRDLPKVSLMTIHAAKGLEFESVYLIGWEEGLFPHSRATEESDEGLEEERRLAYVAITRAKRSLLITRARWRRRQGQSSPQEPSLFLFELPQGAFAAGRSPLEVEQGYAVGSMISAKGTYEGVDAPHPDDDVPGIPDEEPIPSWRRSLTALKGGTPRSAPPARGRLDRPKVTRPTRAKASGADLVQARKLAQLAAQASGAAEFTPGDRIYHEHFGRGKVLALRGRQQSRKVEVEFDSYGVKTLVLQYARIRKLEDHEA